jgi:glycosyltransferase involved in cell wall biosynthesis
MADVGSDLKSSRLARRLRIGNRRTRSERQLRTLTREGDSARDRKDWREAARLYELALQVSPSLHAIRVQLGHAYKELGDFDKAGLNYQAVLELTPCDDDLHLQIGHLEKLKGNIDGAADCYRKAAELNLDNTDALVEYYALASKFGLPPLPPPSIVSDEQAFTGLGESACHLFPSSERAPVSRMPTRDTESMQDRRRDEPLRTALAGLGKEFLNNRPRPKALFVSDSLGTPIHARGIYHYSMALAEILNDMGFELTLVVEKIPGYGLERSTSKFKLSSESLDTYQCAEIYRYFNDNIFTFRWEYENRYFRWLAEMWPWLLRLTQRIWGGVRSRYNNVVNNFSTRINFIPPRGGHLAKFQRFLYIDQFYSTSMSRAVNDLDPVGLSAAGYDVVVIDTPHYVRIKHIERSRVFTVIHDLIPLHDALMGRGWRRIFLSKIRATLAVGGNLIFVSEYTRSSFRELFPKHTPREELVLNPSIPQDWVERAIPAAPGDRSAYITAISRDRVRQRRDQIRARASRLEDDPKARASLIKQLEVQLPRWDSLLPYFATVASDEPRKNVGIFCKIAAQFVDRANFVVVGQVDGDRYMNNEPEMYSNLHFTGYLEDEVKIDIIRHAIGMIFPSFSEGFGIPIVEAALLAVPVICSNLKVFHELTQNLALYFDPNSPDELVRKIDELLRDPTGYAESARGLRDLVLRRYSKQVMERRLQKTLSELGILTRRSPRSHETVFLRIMGRAPSTLMRT